MLDLNFLNFQNHSTLLKLCRMEWVPVLEEEQECVSLVQSLLFVVVLGECVSQGHMMVIIIIVQTQTCG